MASILDAKDYEPFTLSGTKPTFPNPGGLKAGDSIQWKVPNTNDTKIEISGEVEDDEVLKEWTRLLGVCNQLFDARDWPNLAHALGEIDAFAEKHDRLCVWWVLCAPSLPTEVFTAAVWAYGAEHWPPAWHGYYKHGADNLAGQHRSADSDAFSFSM